MTNIQETSRMIVTVLVVLVLVLVFDLITVPRDRERDHEKEILPGTFEKIHIIMIKRV